jgi:hypothetical protein
MPRATSCCIQLSGATRHQLNILAKRSPRLLSHVWHSSRTLLLAPLTPSFSLHPSHPIPLPSPPRLKSLFSLPISSDKTNPTGTPKHHARGYPIFHLFISALRSASVPGVTLTKIRSVSHHGSECTAPLSSPMRKNTTSLRAGHTTCSLQSACASICRTAYRSTHVTGSSLTLIASSCVLCLASVCAG